MNRILVVTGAGRGIGASIARLGAREGYAVCVNYARNQEAAEAVVADIVAAGGRAIAVQGDVAKRSEAVRLFDRVDRELGAVTALVNNAGVTGPLVPVEDMDEKALDQIFGVNVAGLFWCCGEAVRRMARKHGGQGGSIVNVGSIASRYGGMPGMIAYSSSKGAVDSFSVALAKEVGHEGIRVNCLRPGTTRTDILEPLGGDALMARVAASTPLGRVGDPDEIAEAVLWLLSDRASFTHGAILDVSGGR
ncbi:MAG: glucose 1-dehydrogenase [Betaproteobacteria bacterium]|nr:glucose 1-dehydrogenase [Betaproteobacteria bacterium]MBL8534411.1 glucose 1-dehydrogenase [Betaproteobacteria bacterium]